MGSVVSGVPLARNRRIALARHPVGQPVAADFRIEEVPVPMPAPGHLVVANRIVSLDPGIRGWLSETASYMAPVAIGDTVRGMTLGEVVASDDPRLPPGSLVRAMAGWEEVSLIAADALGLEPVVARAGVALEHHMGVLGPAGLTAWIGLHLLGVAAGETVLVSAAAGAVGSVAAQIAQLRGARVIGIAGGADKVAALAAIGVEAIDHRAAPDLGQAIAAAAPDGIDLYFDNVGGRVLEAVLPQMRERGRIVACGMIADYNDPASAHGVRTLFNIVTRRLTMRGFFTYDHPALLAPATAELHGWLAEGRMVPLVNIRDGIAAVPAAFIDLMAGNTIGKTLVRLGS